ncbi:AraC family transcriptional regulator [Noviherbaspirillum saxi]|uniref:AraC family transcriptional regulator n=2 Tax=Noviherbaspirillum saxi TaxID=2320863 RepID=A0A3A3FS67_9BURK|nr:AraC family transcriptional regulator [Noviherbaspirillum saxi]
MPIPACSPIYNCRTDAHKHQHPPMMDATFPGPRFFTILPSIPLRGLISHYWLSIGNLNPTYPMVPDGAIDLVIHQQGAQVQGRVYGTSTSATDVALAPNSHYLGIRFKPGQSRHFIKAAAKELADRCEPVEGLLRFSLENITDNIAGLDIFTRLDTLFEKQVARTQPLPSRIDNAVAQITATYGTGRIEEAASNFGTSRRQFERVFLETVGISPKLFSSIMRFHHAATLIKRQAYSLADIAFESGYTDQSHMGNEFRRLINISPAKLAKSDVAFLLDQPLPPPENDNSPLQPQGDNDENLVWRHY